MSEVESKQRDQIDQALVLLRNQFGLRRFRRGQKSVISRLLKGKNTAAIFPTGGGKSLCYQLPSLLLPGTTVVVSPLIALMKDQCDSLSRKGIAASRLDSSQSHREIQNTLRDLHRGTTKLLYLAPERFFNERFLSTIQRMKISLFAIDEAHCISQWGHHFRPDYLKLAELTKELQIARTLALTATATPTVLNDICKAFCIRKGDAIRTPFFRPNLTIKTSPTTEENQYSYLLSQLRKQKKGATLVYVTLQKTADGIAKKLREDDIDAVAYHAGMDTDKRAEIQKTFLAAKSGVIVATIAFGMGIDKADIRYVYHFNAPKSLESYAQEIGRAGRDGKQSKCEMLLAPEDRIVLDNFTYGDTPTKKSVEHLVDLISGQADHFHLSHYRLSNETNIRLPVLRTLMTYLELEGWIKTTSPRYETYRLKPIVHPDAILNHCDPEIREQIRELFNCLTKGRIWFSLNLTVAIKQLKKTRSQIVELLNRLSEENLIETKVSDLTFGYVWVKRVQQKRRLSKRLHEQLLCRELDEIRRTSMVFEFGNATKCQAEILSIHFGDALKKPCNNCSGCESADHDRVPLEPELPRPIGGAASKLLNEMVLQYPKELAFARDQAKFLCGLSTPQMIRKRLTKHPAFGVCSNVPFTQVLDQVGRLTTQ